MNGNRVLLLQLSERVSGKGNAYLSGWLGKASVVAFRGEPDKHGNETWDVFVSTPEPRPEAGQERDPSRRPQARNGTNVSQPPAEGNERPRTFHNDAPAKRSARPQEPAVVDRDLRLRDPQGDVDDQPARPACRGSGWRGSQYRRPANGAQRATAGGILDDTLEDLYR